MVMKNYCRNESHYLSEQTLSEYLKKNNVVAISGVDTRRITTVIRECGTMSCLITTENMDFQNYIGTIGYDTTDIEGREFLFLALNTSSRFLSDANVRKAIRATINKDDVLNNSYGWIFKTANFPLNTNNYLINTQEENFYNLDEKWNFTGRSGRSAQDPVNPMLNYGYAVVESEIWKSIYLAGLDPYCGFLHSDRYGAFLPCLRKPVPAWPGLRLLCRPE